MSLLIAKAQDIKERVLGQRGIPKKFVDNSVDDAKNSPMKQASESSSQTRFCANEGDEHIYPLETLGIVSDSRRASNSWRRHRTRALVFLPFPCMYAWAGTRRARIL